MLIFFLILILVFIIYIFLCMPRTVDSPDMDMIDAEYAHRGLHNAEIPENSLRAFSEAIVRRYGIELDLQLSSDNVVMVFHDYDLKRMCGVDKKLSECSCAELQSMHLSGSDQTIPTFEQVLRLVGGKIPMVVELKGESRDCRLCSAVAEMLDVYGGIFCVESFNPLILSWFKKYRPNYIRGQLVTGEFKKLSIALRIRNYILHAMLLNFLSRPDFIAYDINSRMTLSHKICINLFGAKPVAWTVRDKATFDINKKSKIISIFENFIP